MLVRVGGLCITSSDFNRCPNRLGYNNLLSDKVGRLLSENKYQHHDTS
jgi:hypothetical protein